VPKCLDSSYIAPSLGRALSVRLVVIGTKKIIVPLFTLLLFKALTLLTPVFDLATSIFATDDVTQVSVIPISPLAAFLRLSETASQVPVRTLLVVKLLTPCFIITVECQVNHGCCVQHHLEVLHMCINFFIVLR
jgi:hypothetical protein